MSRFRSAQDAHNESRCKAAEKAEQAWRQCGSTRGVWSVPPLSRNVELHWRRLLRSLGPAKSLWGSYAAVTAKTRFVRLWPRAQGAGQRMKVQPDPTGTDHAAITRRMSTTPARGLRVRVSVCACGPDAWPRFGTPENPANRRQGNGSRLASSIPQILIRGGRGPTEPDTGRGCPARGMRGCSGRILASGTWHGVESYRDSELEPRRSAMLLDCCDSLPCAHCLAARLCAWGCTEDV